MESSSWKEVLENFMFVRGKMVWVERNESFGTLYVLRLNRETGISRKRYI